MTSRIGEIIGNYRITAEIGSGGFARVYRGEHTLIKERTVALKFLHTYLASEVESTRFLSEASMLERLRHHHILLIYDVGIDQGYPYLVAEYAPNGSLRDRLKQAAGQPLPVDEVVRILSQVGQALHYAHQHHVIHRDLKPENILFNREGEALLADFGIATTMASGSFRSEHISGTPCYMAPEQFTGHTSRESDQYALGCIGYEMLTGHPPFAADTMFATGFMHINLTPPAPSSVNPQVPPHVEAAIRTSMAKERSGRFPDLRDFISALYGGSSFSPITLASAPRLQSPMAWQQQEPGTYPALPFASDFKTQQSSLTGTVSAPPPSGYLPTLPPTATPRPLTLPPGAFVTPPPTMAMNAFPEQPKKRSRRNVFILALVCFLVIASAMGGLAFAAFPGMSHGGTTQGTQQRTSDGSLVSNSTGTSQPHQQARGKLTPTTQALQVIRTPGATATSTTAPATTPTPRPTATFTPTPTPKPSPESLVVYFTNSSGTQTQNSYQGSVTVSISGYGQASQTQYSDAFYRYTSTTGTPTTSPGHPSCWVLWINGEDPSNFGTIPGYNSGHYYTFTMNAPGGTINFKVCDDNYADNTGEYSITITQN